MEMYENQTAAVSEWASAHLPWLIIMIKALSTLNAREMSKKTLTKEKNIIKACAAAAAADAGVIVIVGVYCGCAQRL